MGATTTRHLKFGNGHPTWNFRFHVVQRLVVTSAFVRSTATGATSEDQPTVS
jgi:hypothetical protein